MVRGGGYVPPRSLWKVDITQAKSKQQLDHYNHKCHHEVLSEMRANKHIKFIIFVEVFESKFTRYRIKAIFFTYIDNVTFQDLLIHPCHVGHYLHGSPRSQGSVLRDPIDTFIHINNIGVFVCNAKIKAFC